MCPDALLCCRHLCLIPLQVPRQLVSPSDIVYIACRKPTLLVNSSKGDRASATLRLLPTCDAQMLQLRKLSPDANAVRSIHDQAASATADSAATSQTEQAGAATPHYNTSILQVRLLPTFPCDVTVRPRILSPRQLMRAQ